MANDYKLMDERSLLLALEMSALSGIEAMRDGRMDDWLREVAVGAEIHEVLATRYGWRTAPAPMCQSLRDDEAPCGAPATKVVRGLPGYPWRGIHCDACAERVSKMFDHQGGCVVEAL